MKYLWLFAFVTVILGCNTVDPDSCYPNPAGGAGGADSLAVGAGVGATTSGDYAEPPKGPLENGDGDSSCSNNPCLECPSAPGGLKVFCRKPDMGAVCSERCFTKGIPCVPLALHPYKSDGGTGKLFSCNDLAVGFMCGYQYTNGDACYYPFGRKTLNWCAYSGND
jgi:hypothetical protein